MFVLDFDENNVNIGFIRGGTFFDVFRFPKEKLLDAMAITNYLNGGDGNVIDKERWDALDARSSSGQK